MVSTVRLSRKWCKRRR